MSRRFDAEFTSRVLRTATPSATLDADSACAPDAARPVLRVLSADGVNAINNWATIGDGERLIAESVEGAVEPFARDIRALEDVHGATSAAVNALETRVHQLEQALKKTLTWADVMSAVVAAENQSVSALPTAASPPPRARLLLPTMPASPPRSRPSALGKRVREHGPYAGTLGPFDDFPLPGSPVRMTAARPRTAGMGFFAHPTPLHPPSLAPRRPMARTHVWSGSVRAFGLPDTTELRAGAEEEGLDMAECGL